MLLIIRIFEIANNLLVEQITFAGIFFMTVITIIQFIRYRGSLRALMDKAKISQTIAAVLIFWMLSHYSFVNIERSRSFYLLSWISQNKIQINNGVLNLDLVNSSERLNPQAILDRLAEQQVRGYISVTNNSYSLTKRGKSMLWIAQQTAKLFKLEGWKKNSN